MLNQENAKILMVSEARSTLPMQDDEHFSAIGWPVFEWLFAEPLDPLLEQISSRSVAAILLHLPVSSSGDLVGSLRCRHADVPIVVLLDTSSAGLEQTLYQQGVDAVVCANTQGIQMLLLAHLESAIKRSRARSSWQSDPTVLGASRDIADPQTLRHQLVACADQLGLLSRMLDQADRAICLIEPDSWTIEYVNEGTCKAFGYSIDDFRGMAIKTIAPLSTPDRKGYLLATLRSAERNRFRFFDTLRRSNGSDFRAEIDMQIIRDPRVGERIIAVVLDVTDQINREEALKQAVRRARNAERAKGEFLATVSHELRTPLNAMLGTLYQLQKSELSNHSVIRVKRLDQAARHLKNLLDDILDLSKLEDGSMQLRTEPFSVPDFVTDLRDMFSDLAQTKGLNFLISVEQVEPELIGDELRLKQAVINLLGNAIKFTDDGEIELKLRQRVVDPHHVELQLSVRDTGPGLSKAQRSQIFEPFVQQELGARGPEKGTGLGLSIVQRVAEAMDGEAHVLATSDEGSTFSFTGRLGVAAHTSTKFSFSYDARRFFAQVQSSKSRPDLGLKPEVSALGSDVATDPRKQIEAQFSGARVLIVEDDELTSLIFLDLLTSAGLLVDLASDGAAALARFAQEPKPSVILMDMRMPGMDGPQATAAIRRKTTGLTLPIIGMSANATRSDQQAFAVAGATMFLPKPIEPDALFAAMLYALQLSNQAVLSEKNRLLALKKTGWLDTAPDPGLDEIVSQAAAVCQTPIGLVSLVDEHRQWFKSRIGLDAQETPREFAFCAHAIYQTEDLMIVNDARVDPRFSDNPLVLNDPNIRFYAGAPIRTHDGNSIGTLCVIDQVPRVLNPQQKHEFLQLARKVEERLNSGSLIEVSNHQLRKLGTDELEISERIRERYEGNVVLLVEDDPLTAEICSELLIVAGLVVQHVANGSEALQAMEKGNPPAVILMDMNMPVMGGVEATAAILALPAMSNVPIIGMSANAFNSDRQACLQAGMTRFLAKPIDPDELYRDLFFVLEGTSTDLLSDVQKNASLLSRQTDVNSPCDVNAASRRWSDRALYFRMLKKFRENYRGAASDLKTLPAVEGVMLSHRIKGTALMLCLQSVARCSAITEIAFEANAPAAEHLDDLEAALEEAFDWIDSLERDADIILTL